MKKILSLITLALIFSCFAVQAQTASGIRPSMPRAGIDGTLEYAPDYKRETVVIEEKEQPAPSDIEKKAEKGKLFGKNKDKRVEVTENKEEKPETKPDNTVEEQKPETTDAKISSVTTNNPDAKIQKAVINKNYAYGDLDIQALADEMGDDLEDEREALLGDLRVLWQSTVGKSETIRFAILKLSNPDGEQEKKNMVKKILTPLTSAASLVGMGSGDPTAAGSAIIGSGILSSLLSDEEALMNQHLSRVSDVDLVFMAQEIDNLQQKLVLLYYNYVSAVKNLQLMDKVVENRYKYYEASQTSPIEVLSVADSFYRESIDMQYKARQEVLNARAALEQMVGNEALVEVDKKLKERLKIS